MPTEGGYPRRPPYPSRVKAVLVAFARYSHVHELRLHGSKVETEVTVWEDAQKKKGRSEG